jgi:hypothetical protein
MKESIFSKTAGTTIRKPSLKCLDDRATELNGFEWSRFAHGATVTWDGTSPFRASSNFHSPEPVK